MLVNGTRRNYCVYAVAGNEDFVMAVRAHSIEAEAMDYKIVFVLFQE